MFRINTTVFYVHAFLNTFLFKNKTHYIIYSLIDAYFLLISNKINNFGNFFDKQTCTLIANVRNLDFGKCSIFKYLKKIFKQFFVLLVLKVRYRGKGYKIYLKNYNRIFYQFGRSHKRYVFNINCYYKMYVKSKLFFIGLSYITLKKFLLELIRVKYINIFTARGLRLSRQLVFKKIGKLSAYR